MFSFLQRDNAFFVMLFITVSLHIFIISSITIKQTPQVITNESHNAISLKKVTLTPPKQQQSFPKTTKTPMPVFTNVPVDYILEDITDNDNDIIDVPLVSDVLINESFSVNNNYKPDLEEIRTNYINKLNNSVLLKKVYPRQAKRFSQEGVVLVSFIILKDGTITQIRLHSSSKYTSIDNSALKAVSELKQITLIPDELGIESWNIILPIKYELN